MLLAAFASSCRQDNGYIGEYYGTWKIEYYSIDGVKQENEMISHTTISFQNATVVIQCVEDKYMSEDTRYGTWEELGNDFILNYTHYDEIRDPGTYLYAAPQWLGMTSEAPMVMTKERINSRTFILTWNSPNGIKQYKLVKLVV